MRKYFFRWIFRLAAPLILCSLFIHQTGCSHYEGGKNRKHETLLTKNRVEVLLQVLEGQGDASSDVVSLYARKLESSKSDNLWRWYYVDHESRLGRWHLWEDDKNGVVVIYNGSQRVGKLVTKDGRYFLHDRLHGRGKFGVSNPKEANYPIEKSELPEELWGL